jgi:nitrite reductase/ring-hydroxylating ferredoxin subunit/uncharacterized membrane protein
MLNRYVERAIERIPYLQEVSDMFSGSLSKAIDRGGEPGRHVADVLHGKWLGHPLHPILTDFTIGAWGIGAACDIVALATGDKRARKMGNDLAKIGVAAAVPTMLTGLADYARIQKPAKKTATLHAIINDINLGIYILSIRERSRGNYRAGAALSLFGMGFVTAASWLGGHLVYGHKVGVDHSDVDGPEEWTPTIASLDLPVGKPTRVEVDGNEVLLFRTEGGVYAIAARCNHAGGPLEEGDVEGCQVRCPWHDSVFDLRDGRVIHGPAPRPQPVYAVRERHAKLEVRLISE